MTRMSILESRDRHALRELPRATQTAMRASVDDLQEAGRRHQAGRRRGRRATKHLARGKLLPRDRIRALLDPGSPFLELSPARRATACTTATCPAAGIITGIGRVSGRECVIVANDATVKGGTYFPMTVKKHLRAQEIARAEPPALHLSGRLAAAPSCRSRTRCFPTATTSAASSTTRPTCRPQGIPQIAVVMGSCTAGGAYVPAMCDESDHRHEPGHDLPRRPAAGEGRDRRSRHRRRPRRRRCAHARSPASPTTTPTNDAHALGIARAHRRAVSTAASSCRCEAARAGEPLLRSARSSTASSRPTRASPTTCAR